MRIQIVPALYCEYCEASDNQTLLVDVGDDMS